MSSLPPASAADLVEVLTQDHDKILQLFEAFERSPLADKQMLVEIACTELVIHAQVEEEYLYPALRRLGGPPEALDEAQIEHRVSRQLIGELEAMMPEDELYDARFRVLGAYVRHHIAAEQQTIFPALRAQPGRMAGLADSLVRRRNELRSEFGLPDPDAEPGVAREFPPPQAAPRPSP